ncbi:MAG: YkgJ family cysteine cluster protein [Candidatus Thermoplasmatota archaeon]|nr:YkgJ family cysteine cluster protein [Candidatus Thermoplasmatota archaeon]
MTICMDMKCTKCCQEREIVLTHDDVHKLLTMGHYEQTFARPSKWGHNLKELVFIQGKCIFLKDGICSVYKNRPAACRAFPMTLGDRGPVIDPSCPHGEHFRNDPNFKTEAEIGLKLIIEDIERTIAYSTKK